MRRTRNIPWGYLFLAAPAVLAAAGIQYMIRQTHPNSNDPVHALALKPSSYHPSSAATGSTGRTIASAHSLNDYREPGSMVQPQLSETSERAPAGIEDTRVLQDKAADGQCLPIEYRGLGGERTNVSEKEWDSVMTEFHGVKDDLLAWVKKHHDEFSIKVSDRMTALLEEVRLQRPPQPNEPDLNWRGIGVYVRDPAAPTIRLGSGFLALLRKNPQRGRFELARLVAQAVAPCELQRYETGQAWDPLLQCMGIEDGRVCGQGSFSEAGWAVSSVLAATVSDPGCTLPAFTDGKIEACVTKFPLPLSITRNDIGSDQWKEARR